VQPLPPSYDRRGRFGSLTIALIVLLALVAFSSRSGFGGSGSPAPNNTYISYAMSVFLILFVLAIPVSVYLWITRTREAEDEGKSANNRFYRTLIGIVLLAIIMALRFWIRPHTSFFHNGIFGSGHGLGQANKLKNGAKTTPQPHFEWTVLWVFLGIGLLVVALGIVQWRRREVPVAAEEALPEDELAVTLSDAIDDLEREADPRRAVIAAYARMERDLGRHGLSRRISETSLEYLRRVLLERTARGSSVERLTALFERAKFSTHEITEPMKQDAIASLRDIRDGITA